MTDDETILGRAIAKIDDESLRQTIEREVAHLRGSRRFGLVFDRHLPESVRLIGHPIRRGVKVALRDESSPDSWRVVGFADKSRSTALLDDESTRPVSDLVVIREFGESTYPGLEHLDELAYAEEGAPWHTVINGENFHVLQLLRETHRSQVDLIYIDPPYNTGNDGWIYNDKFVLDADRAKSSKWLSFMERRLTIARDLLKPTGVIIVAIGDDEHHRLRMLMDQVFGPTNFISDVVWQGGRKNDSRYISNGADYMLVYARDEQSLVDGELRWRESRPGLEEMLAAGVRCWANAESDPSRATVLMKEWIAGLPSGHPAKTNNRFYEFEPVSGRVFRKKDISWPGGAGPRYEVLHPETGRPVPVPSRGWIYANPSRMQQEIDAGQILFGPDESYYPNRKLYLDKADSMAAESVFFQKRTSAGKHLTKLLGAGRFPFPKDHGVLMRWFRMVAPKDAVILDFFAGSGTTTEAVMRLNAEDGGTRQSIVVTNNEVGATAAKTLRKAGHHPGDPEWEERGVFEYVTHPRISTVVTGVRPDGSEYSDGLEANVEFLKLTYLDPGSVRRGREFASIAPILWLEHGGGDDWIGEDPGTGWALTDRYGVLFDVDAINEFVEALEGGFDGAQPEGFDGAQPEGFEAGFAGTSTTDGVAGASPADGVERVYVVSDSPAQVRAVAARLPSSIEVVALYDDYLRRFEGNRDR